MSPWYATFVLTGVAMWVGKPAYLAADPLTIQEGWWEIVWAITKIPDKGKGPWASIHKSVNPTTIQI